MKILLIEDDKQVREYVSKGLKESGHNVDMAEDGENGLFMSNSENYDVLIVDRMLPKIDGLTLIKNLRGTGNLVPVLILSALAEVDDRVKGLRAGGDDYLTKPFSFSELLARVEVLERRINNSMHSEDTELRVGDLVMNLLSRKVTKGSEKIELQTREFSLLEYLLKNKGRLVTRTMLLESVWDYHFDPQTNVIDVHISRLRKKINDKEGHLIKTVRGSGYIIEDAASE